MSYLHRWQSGAAVGLPVGKAVCIGRNYLEHVKELGNVVPTRPIIFMKPAAAFATLSEGIALPEDVGACHHEVELTVLVGQTLVKADRETARHAIAGYGIGLDLTLRELQDELKTKGQPWELAKAFDGSAPLSPFIPAADLASPQDCRIALTVNGETRQDATTALMMTPILDQLVFISRHFTLMPGDVLFTGTPAGVAVLASGDVLELNLADRWTFSSRVL